MESTPFEIPLFQILAVLFALAMILHVISGWRRGRRSLRELFAWLILWGCVGGIGAYPHAIDWLSHLLGIKSGANALIFFLLIVLAYIAFRGMFIAEGLEERLSELTRKLALREFHEEQRRDR